jgi:hypothetical protein
MSFADVYWVEVTFKGSQSTDQFRLYQILIWCMGGKNIANTNGE